MLGIVCVLSGLVGCGPSEQRRAELAELKRIECLDKFCPGDIEPPHDMATEVALKLNGQWFIGPSTMKHVIGPSGYYIDHVTYYVATQLKGMDGLPPIASCSHDHPSNGGGTGFMWQPGIWMGTRMNQKHCADWPEIYQEITRVLALLKKA